MSQRKLERKLKKYSKKSLEAKLNSISDYG